MLIFSDLKKVSFLFFISSILIYFIGKFEILNLNIEPNIISYYSFLIAIVSFCYLISYKCKCTLKADIIKVHLIITYVFVLVLYLINNFFNADNASLAFLDIILLIFAFLFQFVILVILKLS